MRNIFNIYSEEYDSWYESKEGIPLYKSELLCLKPLIDNCILPILEIGVGTGRFAKWFPEAVGIDPAFNALKLAQQRGIQVVQAVGEMLPFRDETFGSVFIIFTLCFVQNPLAVLKEAERVLKKKGSIIIGFIPKGSPLGTFYEEKKKQGHPIYSHARFYSLEDLENMFNNCELKISKVKSTLLQEPQENPHVEMPINGFFKEAGFICIEAKIKCIP